MERRERQLTFYKKTCFYASACIQLMGGDMGKRGEAGRVFECDIFEISHIRHCSA